MQRRVKRTRAAAPKLKAFSYMRNSLFNSTYVILMGALRKAHVQHVIKQSNLQYSKSGHIWSGDQDPCL